MRKVFIIAILTVFFFFCTMIIVSAQTVIYRSVQPDPDGNGTTSAIFAAGGTITLTISGTTATFSGAAPDTVGIGNAIQYDSSNAGAVNAICFITGRTSSTVFTVQRFNGGTPASCSGDLDWSVFHPYTKLDNVINGSENPGIAAGVRNFDAGHRNIVTANEVWNIACYRGLDSTGTAQDLSNFLTGANNYIRIYTPTAANEAGVSQRHTGKRIRNCYQLVRHSAIAGITLSVNGTATDNIRHIRIDGLFVKASGVGATYAIELLDMSDNGADCRVTNCVIEGSDSVSTQTGVHVGIACLSGAGVTAAFRIGNNIIYNFKTAATTTNECAVLLTSTNGLLYCYNNLSYKCEQGFKITTGFGYAKNCIGIRATTDSYVGTWQATSTNNYSNAGDTPPGSNPLTVGTILFVSTATNDFHLSPSDAVATNAGADLRAEANFAITTDIDGQNRGDATPAIGADEPQSTRGRLLKVTY